MARYKSRKDRIHHALRMYHGIGTEEHSIDEIAEHLDVKRETTEEYIYESPQSDEIQQTHDEIAEQTRKELIMEKRDRLRQLRELEEELGETVEAVVTEFDFMEVRKEVIGAPGDGIGIADDADADFFGEVPVPSEVKEVPQFNRLQQVWREMRETERELSNLMGLKAPEELKVEGEVTERKLYKLGTDPEDEGYPEQDVQDLSEEESV